MSKPIFQGQNQRKNSLYKILEFLINISERKLKYVSWRICVTKRNAKSVWGMLVRSDGFVTFSCDIIFQKKMSLDHRQNYLLKISACYRTISEGPDPSKSQICMLLMILRFTCCFPYWTLDVWNYRNRQLDSQPEGISEPECPEFPLFEAFSASVWSK